MVNNKGLNNKYARSYDKVKNKSISELLWIVSLNSS